MSATRPPLERVDPEAARHRIGQQEPGCGLGLYAIMLLTISAVGFIGMAIGAFGMFVQLSSVNPKELTSGSEVDAWRLQPLRDAGVLGPDEVPAAWHDESADLGGDPACALLLDRAIRVNEGEGRSLPYAQIEKVELLTPGAGQEVVLLTARPDSGLQDVACRFGPREGGRDMLRQVEVELLRIERGL